VRCESGRRDVFGANDARVRPRQEFWEKLLCVASDDPLNVAVFNIRLCVLRFCIDEILDECFETEALEKALAALMSKNVDSLDVIVSTPLSPRPDSSIRDTPPK